MKRRLVTEAAVEPAYRRSGTTRCAALLAAAALAAVGCGGGQAARSSHFGLSETSTATAPAPPALRDAVAQVRRELRGLAQNRLVLGSPRASLTIIEYANPECPTCATVHRAILPEVIARYVRTGRASIEFRSVTSDSRSHDLALGAYAASSQRHGWDFIQLAYLRAEVGRYSSAGAPAESSAWLATALGLDVPRWRRDVHRPEWSTQIRAALSVASVAQFGGDPVFLLRRRGRQGPFVVLTEPGSVGQFAGAIGRALRPHV